MSVMPHIYFCYLEVCYLKEPKHVCLGSAVARPYEVATTLQYKGCCHYWQSITSSTKHHSQAGWALQALSARRLLHISTKYKCSYRCSNTQHGACTRALRMLPHLQKQQCTNQATVDQGDGLAHGMQPHHLVAATAQQHVEATLLSSRVYTVHMSTPQRERYCSSMHASEYQRALCLRQHEARVPQTKDHQ